jgi:hypothetical protein
MGLGRAAQMAWETGIIYEAAKSDAEKMGVKVQDYLKDITGKEVTDSLVAPLSMLHDATVMPWPWVCIREGQILHKKRGRKQGGAPAGSGRGSKGNFVCL